MNKTDIANIKKELAKRKAANYKWSEGGDMPKDDVMLRTTKELETLIENFSNNKKVIAEQEVKKLVDEIFAEFSDNPEDNMIVLGACNYYEDSRCVGEYGCDEALDLINFDGYAHKYNKLAYPIGRFWDIPNWNNENTIDKDRCEKLIKKSNKIIAKFKDLGLSSIENFWNDDNDALSECWYGVHAITKDYKIVTFVIRDDGMLCDEKGFETFHNSIIYTIK